MVQSEIPLKNQKRTKRLINKQVRGTVPARKERKDINKLPDYMELEIGWGRKSHAGSNPALSATYTKAAC